LNILTIIPARIGSKGIPQKNLLKIGRYTLIERALFLAINSENIDDIVVSTDSKKIQNIVNKYGNHSLFIRPKELATDDAGSLGVIQHSLLWAEKNYNKKYNYIVLIEPPSPFRLPEHVKQGIEIAIQKKATSVVSLVEVGDYHPIRMKEMNSEGRLKGAVSDEPDGLRRQEQKPLYIRNCAVYIFSCKTIKENKLWGEKPYGFEMEKNLYGINIDEPSDYSAAKILYREMKTKNNVDQIETIINNI